MWRRHLNNVPARDPIAVNGGQISTVWLLFFQDLLKLASSSGATDVEDIRQLANSASAQATQALAANEQALAQIQDIIAQIEQITEQYDTQIASLSQTVTSNKTSQDSVNAQNSTQIQNIQSAVQTLQNQLAGLSFSIPELLADPTAAQVGQQWVKRTVLAVAGSLQGFYGEYPVQHLVDVNRFDLSVQTSDGVRRVELT